MSVATQDPTAAPKPTPSGNGLGDYARRWWIDVRSGDLGSLPIIVGLIVIAIVFQTANSNFLTAGNFVNLIIQSAAYALVAMGIVFVLLLGEIDLSVGYVSGVAGVLVSLFLTPDGNVMPAFLAVVLSLLAGLAIGVFQGGIVTKIGIPSFVVTLAGLLGWNGVVLLLIGSRGTVILQNNFVIGLANNFMSDALSWILVVAVTAAYGAVLLARMRSRAKLGLPNEPFVLVGLRVGLLFVILAIVTAVANQDRGIPWVGVIVGAFLVFWTFVLNRTRFGRHIYAVGGNQEAARRAGINVDRIKMACFALCSFMAAVGGVVLASRLRSVDTSAGGGQILLYSIAAAVIGGTSLFGGRGNMKSAILGALVIGSIDNGLGLLGLSAGTKFVVTGAVLLLAVAVDSISRKGRAQSGRA
ncbi:MAG: D-xylose transport system permease protein [Solirubrobacteraceae bacterium]|jgi:D-xylose transport system permease protein|nr:D-xylose transport system permease protein [Solirubrobacteraceae bacterium]